VTALPTEGELRCELESDPYLPGDPIAEYLLPVLPPPNIFLFKLIFPPHAPDPNALKSFSISFAISLIFIFGSSHLIEE
jgi:hypothetical protein